VSSAKNARSEIGAVGVGMEPVFSPEVQGRSFLQRIRPGETNGHDRHAKPAGQAGIPGAQPRLHPDVGVWPADAMLVPPGHEQNSLRFRGCDLPPEAVGVGICLVQPVVLRAGEVPAAFLKDDRVPGDVLEKTDEAFVVVRPLECPTVPGPFDGEDRRRSGVSRCKLVEHVRHLVVKGQAVADEQNAKARLLTPGKIDVATRDRKECASNDTGLREADIDRHGEHQHNPQSRKGASKPAP
jgi:hypothetical protein